MSWYGAGAKIGSNLMKNFGHAGLSVAEDLGMTAERESSRVLRGAFSSAAKKTGLKPQNVRTNKTAIQDIISQNAGRPGSYATPPFKGGSMGRPAPGAGRAAARREELIAKRKAKPKPGQFYTPAPKGRSMGPDTKMQSKVDDLFGVKW